MRRFYAPIENFDAGKVLLNVEETRHLRDVLRLREGSEIQVFDGAGREFLCAVAQITKRETALEIVREIAPAAPESDLDLTLAVALLKGEKFELVVQKAVELGVTRLVPLNTRRADVKLKEADKKMDRWQKIALEAAKQSGRARLMEIAAPVDFEKFVAEADGAKILFSERHGEGFAQFRPDKKITALVGSEGGWEDSELETAAAAGFRIVTLKGRILRAETAAIVVSAILQNNFGDLS
ncbi:MAG TPA: 16S rRNA (uracil(1498)-N(3))-methyltransferase [Pyrinomonadaceae bacterium]|jgi:16S rRNA (uracil1498-N3)-methyltransferase